MKSLSLSKPHVIVMVGIPGSGKTFFAEKFSETFHAPYVNREKIATLASNSEGADALAEYQLDELLKTGQSLIVEGGAETRSGRLELAKKARKAGYETLLVWVQTDPAAAKARAIKATKDATGTPPSSDEYDRLAKKFTPPAAVEKPMVISGRHTYATQAKAVLQRLSAPRAAISTHTSAPVRTDPTRRNITVR